MELPPTYQELQKAEAKKTAGGKFMDSFLDRPVFSVQMLNVLLVLWIIRHALPWMRFSDPILRGAFKLANPSADMRSPTWAAQTAKKVYKSLHSEVLQKVKVSFFIFHSSHCPINNTIDQFHRLIPAVSGWSTTCGQHEEIDTLS
jgi:hypothetical protein